MRRLELSPARHRHHRAQPRPLGPRHRHGRARAPARAARDMPVLIHPEFWSPPAHRVARPRAGRAAHHEQERAGGAGFEIVEERQPSFLLDGSLLVTGEVDRTTEFEPGFPGHEAHRDGEWEPDPLILDDQALVAQRPRPRPRRADRLRPLRHRQHPALRPPAHRRGPDPRRHRRLPPQRAGLRADHRRRPATPSPSSPRTSSSPPTAPAGGPPTRSPRGSPTRSSRTASAPASSSSRAIDGGDARPRAG